MSKRVFCLTVIILLLTTTTVAASNFLHSHIPDEVKSENKQADYELQYSIVIENFKGGNIFQVNSNGDEEKLGNVLVPTDTTYTASDGFWAAQYSRSIYNSSANVTATGVNAMHLRVAPDDMYNPKQAQKGHNEVWKPKLISLLPDREYDKIGSGPHYGRIATDIPGGKKLFGGTSSAYVGSPIYYLDNNGKWEDVENYYYENDIDSAPKNLKIDVYKPSTEYGTPTSIIFENKVRGDVVLNYSSSYSKSIATVLQRVEGTGRFGGSEYADTGFVRANHGGVIDLSTSPYVGFTWDAELRGGFQIVPSNHAVYSRYFLNLNYIDRPQYMIVAHKYAEPYKLYDPVYFDEEEGLSYDPHFEAVAPLFANYIKPKHVTNQNILPPQEKQGLPERTIKGQSTRFVISYDKGKTWLEPEPAVGVHDDNLIDVTHLKVYLEY